MYPIFLVTWMMVYPAITGLGLALNPVLKDRPLFVRNFAITAIFVPFMVYGAVPVARKIVIELDAKQSRKKEEGRGKKEEGRRRKREEGRRKKKELGVRS